MTFKPGCVRKHYTIFPRIDDEGKFELVGTFVREYANGSGTKQIINGCGIFDSEELAADARTRLLS